MSSISELIAKMEKENEMRRQKHKRELDEQDAKYVALTNRMIACESNMVKQVETMRTEIKQLVANKHSIEKALKEREDIKGLPIPQEQHKDFIDFVSKGVNLLSNPDILNGLNTLSINQVQNDVKTFSENVQKDLQEYNTEFTDAKALFQAAKLLNKQTTDDKSKSQENLDTLPEEESM